MPNESECNEMAVQCRQVSSKNIMLTSFPRQDVILLNVSSFRNSVSPNVLHHIKKKSEFSNFHPSPHSIQIHISVSKMELGTKNQELGLSKLNTVDSSLSLLLFYDRLTSSTISGKINASAVIISIYCISWKYRWLSTTIIMYLVSLASIGCLTFPMIWQLLLQLLHYPLIRKGCWHCQL